MDSARNVLTIVWRIENYSYRFTENNKRIRSPCFRTDHGNGSKWYLQLSEDPLSKENCFEYQLIPASADTDFSLDFELAHINTDGEPEISKEITHLSSQNNSKTLADALSDGLSIKMDELFGKRQNELLPNDILTLRCKVKRTQTKYAVMRTHFGLERSSFMWDIDTSTSESMNQKTIIATEADLHVPFHVTISCAENSGLSVTKLLRIQVRRDSEDRYRFCTLRVSPVDEEGNTTLSVSGEHLFTPGETDVWELPGLIFNPTIFNQTIFSSNNTRSREIFILKIDFTVALSVSQKIDYVLNDIALPFEMSKVLMDRFQPLKSNSLSVKCLGTCKIFSGASSDLKSDFGKLLMEKEFCDFTLKIGNEEYPVHKCVLSARSRVFRSMLNSDMQEKVRESVEIEDVNSDTLQRFLLYLYTDTIKEMDWQDASELYVIADKYEVLSLKHNCRDLLKSQLSLDNVCDLVIMSSMYNDKELKVRVKEFIAENEVDIIGREQWTSIEKDHTEIALEVLRYIVVEKRRKLQAQIEKSQNYRFGGGSW